MHPTALDVFGTLEPLQERRLLVAGPLSAVLEGGQLRSIRWHGVEALRGVAFLLRDAAWGTAAATLSDHSVAEAPEGFAVRYVARAEVGSGRLVWQARIEGRTDGSLRFVVTARAESDVTTNRAGFVVLHPDTVAGAPLEVLHPDGRTEATAFPEAISPHQPVFDIAGLAHAPAPGLQAEIRFEGGVWEMEDQRNWSDASFKTYVRPLDWPRPYFIAAGSEERQAVALTLSGVPAPTPRLAAAPAAGGVVPALWLRLADGEPVPEALPLPRLAHGLMLRLAAPLPDRDRLAQASALAERSGLALAIEATLPMRDPEAEAASILDAIAGLAVEALLVTAARDARNRPSGLLPPGEAPLEEAIDALRRGGFAGRLGTGTPAFFTEFNRNPPPAADIAFFGSSAIVHAADDTSVAETVGVLPAILDSAQRLAPGAALWPGPLAIAATINPNGPGLAASDGTARVPMAGRDPRHGALFGAAYLVGVLAAVAGRAEAAAPLCATGPIGLAGPDGGPLPLAFVHAEVAGARDAALVPPPWGDAALLGLAWATDGGVTALLANLAPGAVTLPRPARLASLDRLALGSGGWRPMEAIAAIAVPPYATLRLRLTP